MSTVLQEKRPATQVLSKRADSCIPKSNWVFAAALLTSMLFGASIFSAKTLGVFEISERDSLTLATIGVAVCFASLPFLVVMYRKQERVALVAGGVVLLAMLFLAGMTS